MEKRDLRAAQERAPPFGDYLCVPEAEIFHIHGTSGTTGRPTAFAIGRDDWRAIANAHARIMWAMGLRPGDTICVAAIFSLYMGSWGALAGAERLRRALLSVRRGRCRHVGALRAMAQHDQADRILRHADLCAASCRRSPPSEGLNPRDFRLKIMFFSGEPGASIPGVRGKIEELYGASVIDCGSMAEMTPWMNVAGTAETSGMLCWQDIVYTEVCDPDTMRRVPYGARGTPVYTHLERTSQPMIRLLSGDLTLWTNDENPCGRTYPRLPQGIFGRIDDMFTIRGENVYPSEIDAALNELAALRRRAPHRDQPRRGDGRTAAARRSRCRDLPGGRRRRLPASATEVERKLHKVLGLRALVEVVEPNSIARTDFKARRVIDDRKIFADMHAQIEKGAIVSRKASSSDLVARVAAGEQAAIARLISRAEHANPEVRGALASIYKLAGRAHVVGITGVPGSGKSTLVAKLTEKLRAKGGKVGVIAIDPSSPYSGGAILGDRIRMTELAGDPGVFIRSMATHGATGGMAHTTLDAVDILDVAGFDTIIIETVGVGQDEVEIVKASHTTVVVSAPGLGDDIQAIKAGILEIADIHVVSKCDRSDANRTIVDLKQMLTLGMAAPAAALDHRRWSAPARSTAAGFDALARGDRAASQNCVRDAARAQPRAVDRAIPAAQDRGKPAAATFRRRLRQRRRLARGAARRAARPIRTRLRPNSSKRQRCANLREHIMNRMLDPKSLELVAAEQVADWERNEVAAFLRKQRERREQFFTTGDIPVKRVYTAADVADTPLEDIGLARPLSVHARAVSDHVPQPALDHAPDRGLRHRRGHQQALQIPDQAGPDRPVHRLRYADADGLRQRPSDERGRGRPRGRGGRHARRHGSAL